MQLILHHLLVDQLIYGIVNLQEKVLASLISMFRTENTEIRNAARDAILRINVSISIPQILTFSFHILYVDF